MYQSLENEADLIEQAKYDPNSFLVLYNHYLPQIYKYVYYHTLRKHEAEDVVSQTFLQALKSLSSYKNRGIPFGHWLYRIATNILYHNRQQQNKADQAAKLLLPEEPDYDIEKLDLLREIRKLPDNQQQVLQLRYIQDLSIYDTAGIMGCSEGSVKQLTFRAINTLRERMSSDDDKHDK